jgi:precorrin-3B C17-methyltransferase
LTALKNQQQNKKLYVVGIGPGSMSQMSPRAHDALFESSIICGYHVYVDLVRDEFPSKEFVTTAMTREVDRCRAALEKASEGNTVSMICSGDPNVYGMGSLIYELKSEYDPDIEIEVISGISAVLSGGAVLGSPISEDYAVISLSDHLTPWDVIEKRLNLAADADFCICLYNPQSRQRPDYLSKACEIFLKFRGEDTVCGYVSNIDRENENAVVLSLGELKTTTVDMFTTVFIGNSRTRLIDGKMVTPRGYQNSAVNS